MVIVGETNRSKLAKAERSASGEGPDKLLSHKVIDFESGRKALEKGLLKEEQSRASLVERIPLPRLSGDLLQSFCDGCSFMCRSLRNSGLGARDRWGIGKGPAFDL
jgi:hypothetical protein